jgi:hypothetical protein
MQGVGDIIRSEDTLFGEDGGDGEGLGLLEAGNDDMDVTIDVVEARVLNRTAGESCQSVRPLLFQWVAAPRQPWTPFL